MPTRPIRHAVSISPVQVPMKPSSRLIFTSTTFRRRKHHVGILRTFPTQRKVLQQLGLHNILLLTSFTLKGTAAIDSPCTTTNQIIKELTAEEKTAKAPSYTMEELLLMQTMGRSDFQERPTFLEMHALPTPPRPNKEQLLQPVAL